jgi:hypothetical protein
MMICFTFNSNLAKKLLFALLSLIVLTISVFAEPKTVSIKDWTGRGFPPDLVNYIIPTPADGGTGLRVLDSTGKSLPVQLTPGEKGKSTLSFVASVSVNGTSVYTIQTDGKDQAAPATVSAIRDGDTLVLANQNFAVKVPTLVDNTYDKPVAADTLPAPILAFRGPDGPSTELGTGAWRGAGTMLVKRPVKKFTVVQTANGPVFTEIRYRLEYIGGGYYQAVIRVTDRAPFAQVREEYDLGVETDTDFWQLDLSKGWQPDAAEHMNVAGQGNGPATFVSLAVEEKAKPASIDANIKTETGGDVPLRFIHHDSCWGSKFVAYYGVQVAAARQADPKNYPMAIVAPLHKGDWRRANSMPVYVKGGQVRVQFPMSVTQTSWLKEPRSDTSPFSAHEHDPALPTTYGRRVWALVLTPPTMTSKDLQGEAGTGNAVRIYYGVVGLDRYKDYVLDWPDAKVNYPRVFTTPDWLAKPAQGALPAISGGSGRSLQASINYIVSSISIHHHHALGDFGGPVGAAEAALANPNISAEERRQLRTRLALLSYLLTEPDVTSAGNGSHHGNPNMGVARLSDRGNLAALIPDHPMHKTWADYMGSFLAYKQATFMAPEGAWIEYGASYHMHGYGKIERGIMGLLADKTPQADQAWAYNRADFDYLLNLLSPIDPRYGSRIIPGTANAPCGQSPHYLQAMGTVADKDPELAANLRWAWENNGKMVGTGGDAITIPAMIRPSIAAKEPTLTSRVYPGYGVIFRAHQGADETALYLRSGYHWSHWGHDQGNMILYAKGAVLLPPQPYQYGGPKDPAFPDKNFLRFGSPVAEMPYDWSDSNILDAQFGQNVDYAWHSTGYPDWWITPGAPPGWAKGVPNVGGGVNGKMIPGLGQKEGAFTWDRQVVFLKSPNAKGANYFVIRDSTQGDPSAPSAGSGQAGSGQGGQFASWFNLSLLGRKANVTIDGAKVSLDTEWPTKLDMLFTDRANPTFEMVEDDLTLAVGPYSNPTGTSRDWTNGNKKEQHVALRLQSAPGQGVAWVLFPRGAGETTPTATQLAPGVTKVVTTEGTDYVFLSTTPLEYKGDGIEFSGQAGTVRIPNTGKPELVLLRGSKLKYKGKTVNGPAANEQQVIAEGGKVRFFAPAPVYVKLTNGNMGVRGMGPFDLTFTPDGIIGKVDGDIRTIVTTWPEKIVRPGYWMDGVRWCAGFADEPSISKGMATPQFSLAIGVSAGKHAVKIAEWEWPAMPTPPARTALTLEK